MLFLEAPMIDGWGENFLGEVCLLKQNRSRPPKKLNGVSTNRLSRGKSPIFTLDLYECSSKSETK
jgi:hypothetical protein